MSRLTIFVLTIFLFLTGCTVRYSKSLVGTVSIKQYKPLTSESSGLEIYYIVGDEPESARNLSFNLACENALTQVDYRSNIFTFFVPFSLPKVKVKTLCSE